MKAIIITAQKILEETSVTRSEIIKEFEIHIRDLRPIFLLKQISTIITRDNCIIVNFGDIKGIIGKKKVYIFETTLSEEVAQDVLTKLSEKNESKTPFEFIVLEALLQKRSQELTKHFSSLEKKANTLLPKLRLDPAEENLEKLLALKKALSMLEIRVKESRNTIYEILEDDEELRYLRLAAKEVEKDMEEIESILENHFEQIENIEHTISALNENIDDTQEIVTMKMAHTRNVIIRFDLVMSIVTALLAVLTVITGLYGMNIRNSLENNFTAFWGIAGGLIIFFLLAFGAFWMYLKKKKILS